MEEGLCLSLLYRGQMQLPVLNAEGSFCIALDAYEPLS